MSERKDPREVTMTHARFHFHEVVRTIVETGEPVVITQYGRPMMQIEPYGGEDPVSDPPQCDG